MERKKSHSTASASGGKKDENFLTKTAHSIRDKVHGFTDDVKEKTHNLTHSSESKKNNKEKKAKKIDSKLKTSPKPRTAGKKEEGSDSDDEDDSPAPPLPSSASAAATRSRGQNSDTLEAKPSAVAASASSKTSSDQQASKDSASKSSDNYKDTTASSSSARSSIDNFAAESSESSLNKDSKPSTVKLAHPTDDDDATNELLLPTANNRDQVHISFDGVFTVDDLLDRIDEAVENARIIVENGDGTDNINMERTLTRPVPSTADLEKKPVKRVEDNENKEEKNWKKTNDNEEEPIRINYNEIHRIEDLISKIDQQPGHRKVMLENTPNNSGSVTVFNQSNSSRSIPQTSRNSNQINLSSTITTENDDRSAPLKSILKTSQDPSSLDTSTKTSSFEDDQIHVNIEGAQGIDDLSDRIIDDAIHTISIMDRESQKEKRQAPQAPTQQDNRLAGRTSPKQKREAPKAPYATDEQHHNGENTPSMAVSQFSNFSSVLTTQLTDNHGDQNAKSSPSTRGRKKKDENEISDWI